MTQEPKDPKIVVDEDWKERVRAERQAAREARKQADRGEDGGDSWSGPAPPDPFSMLVSSLAAEAMMALGQAPDPSQGHPVVRPELARHSIDMLDMLEEKTKGNLSPDQSQMLDSLLHQLRMLYVQIYRPPSEASAGGDATAAGSRRDSAAEDDPGAGEQAPAADDPAANSAEEG